MDIKRTLKRPAVLWTALALILLLGALLVPIEWVNSFGDLVGESAPKTTAFTTQVAEVDEALGEGEAPGVDEQKLREMLPHIQVRRLLQAGPMTANEVQEATDLVVEFNRQIASQQQEGSRQALRKERNRQLADALPRLDPEKIAAKLDELDRQLKGAGFRLDELTP